MNIDAILEKASVIPVLEVARLGCAAPLARALAAGGLSVVELTLRTDCALDAVKAMQDAASDLIIGMGTVRTRADIEKSMGAGAAFLVTPGSPPQLLAALKEAGIAALPGTATASEAMTVFEAGFAAMKFFPAEQAGGIKYLKSLHGPLPDCVFCPTGGIGPDRAPDYLALPNVACVGGSWVAPRAMIDGGVWEKIEGNARRAMSMQK